MTALVKYEAARAALQAAHDVDEVKDIRDKAQAIAAYAKQAQDTSMVLWASEIKVRAERRAGEMLADMPKINGSRGAGKKVELPEGTPLLTDLGISKKQSSAWQKVAEIPEDKFEKAVAATKESGVVTTAAVLRTATKPKAAPRPAAQPKVEKQPADVAKLKTRVAELEEVIERQQEALDALADTDKSAEAFKDKKEFQEMQVLRLELKSCKRRRDELMRENGELKKEVARWKKKAGAK